jgi:hypothetical protein
LGGSSINYSLVNLSRLLKQITVERTQSILSTYICPQNQDIEDFLHNKAIEFAEQGIAQTHLIFSANEAGREPELLGYFVLANKIADIPVAALSKTYQKKVGKFGVLTPEGSYMVPMPLIAQLGKNYNKSLIGRISGTELLSIACEKVASIQVELGGRCVYLECEDSEFLTAFYYDNGFRRFSPDNLESGQLVRMIRYQ